MKNIILIKKSIFISLFFGAAITVFIFIFLFPVIKEINGLGQKIMSQRKEAETFEAEIDLMEIFDEKEKILQKDLEKINLLLADKDVPVKIIQLFESLAEKNGLIIEISPGPNLGNDSRIMDFRLNLIGAYSDTLRFIEQLETGPCFAQVNSVYSRKASVRDDGASLTETNLKLSVLSK